METGAISMQFLVSRTGYPGNWERISLYVIPGRHCPFNVGRRAESQRDRHRTKWTSVVFTELLRSDSYFNSYQLCFNHILDGDNDVETAAAEPLELWWKRFVTMFVTGMKRLRPSLGQQFRCDDCGLIWDKPFADLLFSSFFDYVFELAIERLLK